ncbi:MAG: hypothetical protein ABJE10_17165 [bacterium]
MQDLFIALGFAFIPTTAALIVMYFSVRSRALKAEQIVHDLTVVPALRGQQRRREPDEMANAIDAIALEVERIAEGQRFTTRLLSESRRSPALGAGDDSSRGRSITPH